MSANKLENARRKEFLESPPKYFCVRDLDISSFLPGAVGGWRVCQRTTGGPHPPSFGECGEAGSLHACSVSLLCRPLGFDFHSASLTLHVVAEAAPRPFFGFFYQSPLDRV